MQAPASLEALPTEILSIIFSTFCYHCTHTHDATADVESAALVAILIKNLVSLCLVSKRLRYVAQPVLFHYQCTAYLTKPSLCFIRTIFARPDLARYVRCMTFQSSPNWVHAIVGPGRGPLDMRAAFDNQATRLDIPTLSWPLASDLQQIGQFHRVLEFVYEVIFRTVPNLERLTCPLVLRSKDYAAPYPDLDKVPKADLLPSLKSLSLTFHRLSRGLYSFLGNRLPIQNLTSLRIGDSADPLILVRFVHHAKNLESARIDSALDLGQVAEVFWECRHSLNYLVFKDRTRQLSSEEQPSSFSLRHFPSLRTICVNRAEGYGSFTDDVGTFFLESLPRSLVELNFRGQWSKVVLRCAAGLDVVQQGVLPNLRSMELRYFPDKTKMSPDLYRSVTRLRESGVDVRLIS